MGVTNNYCQFSLTKDYEKRPKYGVLLRDPFIKRYASEQIDVAAWFAQVQQTIAQAQANVAKSNP